MELFAALLLLSALGSFTYSGAFELQDTINGLRDENLQLHVQVANLTAALRELRHLLWDYSRGLSSTSRHNICSYDPRRDAAQIVWPLQDLIVGCLISILFWMQNLFN